MYYYLLFMQLSFSIRFATSTALLWKNVPFSWPVISALRDVAPSTPRNEDSCIFSIWASSSVTVQVVVQSGPCNKALVSSRLEACKFTTCHMHLIQLLRHFSKPNTCSRGCPKDCLAHTDFWFLQGFRQKSLLMVLPVMQRNDARISRITVIKLPEGWGSWKHQMIQIVEELPASWQLSTGVFLGGKLPEKKSQHRTGTLPPLRLVLAWLRILDPESATVESNSVMAMTWVDLGSTFKPQAFEYSLCSPWNHTLEP